MDTTTETKTEDVKKHHHHKKKHPAKGGNEGRPRARTTIASNFESKKTTGNKKESKPIETIGENRFKDLLSRFDKGNKETQENSNGSGPKKLDMSKFANFTPSGQSDDKNGPNSQVVVSNKIKERMEALLNSNKMKRTSEGVLDPVLEQRKKLHQVEGEDYNEDYDDDEADDISISSDEEKESNEADSDYETESQKENKVETQDIKEEEKLCESENKATLEKNIEDINLNDEQNHKEAQENSKEGDNSDSD